MTQGATTLVSLSVETTVFLQLVVNCVMATDIMDRELLSQRNERWDATFIHMDDQNTSDASNRKATLVIDTLIQASDVAHTSTSHEHVSNIFMSYSS